MAIQKINTLWGIETFNPTPNCSIDGCENPRQHTGHYNKYNAPIYRSICHTHHSQKYKTQDWDYKNDRKDYCENIDGRLGFYCTDTIVKPNWQLDVDHVDGNRKNRDKSNLHTLCKNCHQYKTFFFRENQKKRDLFEQDQQKKENLIEYVKRKYKKETL